jgi:hypothetical protein
MRGFSCLHKTGGAVLRSFGHGSEHVEVVGRTSCALFPHQARHPHETHPTSHTRLQEAHVFMQVEASRQTRRRREREMARVGGSVHSWLVRWLWTKWLQAGYAFADHTRNALILTVFVFKVCPRSSNNAPPSNGLV